MHVIAHPVLVEAARLTILPYRADLKHAWDSVVERSRNGNFLHFRDYMEYHADRYEDCSLLVMRCGQPVAAFPANREGSQVTSHAGLTYGGLLFGPGLYAAEVLEIFRMLAHHYREAGTTRLVYKAIPHAFHRMPADEDLYALFQMDAKLVRRDLGSVVEMNARPAFKRKGLSRARRAGLSVREGDFVVEFHAMICDALSRHEARPVHSVEEIRLLRERFPGRIRLFGSFSPADELLASTLVFDYGNVVHTQYSASSAAGRHVGALDVLLVELISGVFADRPRFSFGTSCEDGGRVLNEGLVHQKEGFGARGVVHDFYAWELA